MPPEQVHAVGVQALDALKDATHEPVAGARGFGPTAVQPPMFFANGGDVARVGNSYSGGNVAGAVTINGGAPRGTNSIVDPFAAPQAPVAPPDARTVAVARATPSVAPAPVAPGASPGVIDSSAQRQQFFDRAMAGTAVAQGFAPGRARAPIAPAPAPGYGFTPRSQQQPPDGLLGAPPQDGFGFQPRGYANGGAVTDEERDKAVFGVYPKPSSSRSTNANDAALRRGVVATGPSSFQPADVVQPAGAPVRLNNRTDPRSTQFAGPASEGAPLGMAPVLAAASKPAAADTGTDAATPSAAGASTASAADPAAGGGFGFVSSAERTAQMNRDIAHEQDKRTWRSPGDQAPGLAVIDGAGFGQAARQRFFDDANLRTAAARGSWLPRRGFQSDEGAVRAAAVPVQARAAADIEQVRQDGEAQRAGFGFQTLAQREAAAARMQGERIAAEDRRAADANSIRRDEVAGANRVRDVQVTAAQDEAALRRTLLDPNASVSDRAKAQQALLAAQGKVASPEWSVQVTPATKNADGSSTEGSIYRVNKSTGEVQRVDGAGTGRTAPPNAAVQALKADPRRAADFDAKYGAGAAQRALG